MVSFRVKWWPSVRVSAWARIMVRINVSIRMWDRIWAMVSSTVRAKSRAKFMFRITDSGKFSVGPMLDLA
jgi:hypothetical protein